ncbi:putative RNA recognition motif domain, nucleotide-binding alpha-beta plait domain superfamily [Helianthus anomalus]
MASSNDGEGEQDGGGPWSNVQYRKNKISKGDGVEWTFLPYGYVSDVYVARKRDARGKCFGFVRYVGVEKMKETLVAMNTIKMFDMKVSVSLVKYDKDHKKFNYASDTFGRSEWRPKANNQLYNNVTSGNKNGDQPSGTKHQYGPGPSGLRWYRLGRHTQI